MTPFDFSSPDYKFLIYNIIATICILMSLSMFYLIFSWAGDITKSHEAENWSKARGIVTQSEPVKYCGRGQSQLFFPAIKYSYLVDGHSYDGYQIALGVRDCEAKNVIENLLAPYPLGKSVTVWFNPQHPEESVLLVAKVSDATWSNIHDVSIIAVISVLLSGWFIYKGKVKSVYK